MIKLTRCSVIDKGDLCCTPKPCSGRKIKKTTERFLQNKDDTCAEISRRSK
jgi:hypothetical protein